MNNSLVYLRAVREILSLPPLSEAAEKVYIAALANHSDEEICRALTGWARSSSDFPSPHQLGEMIKTLALRAAQIAAEQGKGLE